MERKLNDIFGYDGPVIRIGTLIFDLIMLDLVWIVMSGVGPAAFLLYLFGNTVFRQVPPYVAYPVLLLLLIHWGPATTALHYTIGKRQRKEEGYTLRDYFRSYRQNYKQAILISALLTAGGLLIGYNLYLVGSYAEVFGSVAHILYALEIVIGVELLFLSLYLFAILARVEMKTKALFRYAFAMVHKHLGTTLLCAAIAAAGFALVYSVHLMTMIFAVSVPCYAITALLEKVFRRYMDE